MTAVELMERVAARWRFDARNYPNLALIPDPEPVAEVGHVALHVAKDAGKLAAAVEPAHHGRPADIVGARRAARNLLVDALRLCALLQVDPEAAVENWALELDVEAKMTDRVRL